MLFDILIPINLRLINKKLIHPYADSSAVQFSNIVLSLYTKLNKVANEQDKMSKRIQCSR